jgi:hypothetical protein
VARYPAGPAVPVTAESITLCPRWKT